MVPRAVGVTSRQELALIIQTEVSGVDVLFAATLARRSCRLLFDKARSRFFGLEGWASFDTNITRPCPQGCNLSVTHETATSRGNLKVRILCVTVDLFASALGILFCCSVTR